MPSVALMGMHADQEAASVVHWSNFLRVEYDDGIGYVVPHRKDVGPVVALHLQGYLNPLPTSCIFSLPRIMKLHIVHVGINF